MKAKIGSAIALAGCPLLLGLRFYTYLTQIDPKTGVLQPASLWQWLPFGVLAALLVVLFCLFLGKSFTPPFPMPQKGRISLGVSYCLFGLSAIFGLTELLPLVFSNGKLQIAGLLLLLVFVLGVVGLVWSGVHLFASKKPLPWALGLMPLPMLIGNLVTGYLSYTSIENSAEFPFEMLMLAAGLLCYMQLGRLLTGFEPEKVQPKAALACGFYLLCGFAGLFARQGVAFYAPDHLLPSNTPSLTEWFAFLPPAMVLILILCQKQGQSAPRQKEITPPPAPVFVEDTQADYTPMANMTLSQIMAQYGSGHDTAQDKPNAQAAPLKQDAFATQAAPVAEEVTAPLPFKIPVADSKEDAGKPFLFP